MEERKGLIRWIKKHKKELIVAGVCCSIGALILYVLLTKRENIKSLWGSLRKVVEQPTANAIETGTKVAVEIPREAIQDAATVVVSNPVSDPIEVSSCICTLHDGWHASPEKIATAQENGFKLGDNQTWVCSYTKRSAAA